MNEITNQSSLQYQFKIDPNKEASSNTKTSNLVTTSLISPSLVVTGSADLTYATIDDVITYTFQLTNNGNILLSNLSFQDPLPTELEFVTGSVKVDNVSEASADPKTGISLTDLALAKEHTVSFQAKVKTLPNPNTLTNQATVTFQYLVTSLLSSSTTSNEVTTTIHVSNVSVVKSVDVTAVEVNDEITYTIVITNEGNINATNLFFQDTLDSKLTFKEGSVTVDGTSEPTFVPATGFALADLAPTASTTVVFKATVNG